MASTGFNKLEDIFRSKGTSRLAPYGGIVNGSAIGAITAAAGVVTVAVGAGSVVLDSRVFALAAGSLITPALPNGLNSFAIWVIPVRKTLALSALPNRGVEGDIVYLTTPADENTQYLNKIYVFRAAKGGFVEKNEDVTSGEKDAIFESNTDYFRNLPFSEITGSRLSFTDEKSILFSPNKGMPPELAIGPPSYARYASGFAIGKIDVTLTAGVIATPATDVVIHLNGHAKILV